MTRRDLLAGLLSFTAPGAPAGPARLIAHRGGVVEPNKPENSAAALEEALRLGYWMVEIDLRPTSDGAIVLHHDATLQKRFGDPRAVERMTLAECRAIRGPHGDRLLTIEEAVEIGAGPARFMLDAKGENWPEPSYSLLQRTLQAGRHLTPLWVLGGEAVKRRLEDRAEASIGRAALQRLLDNGEHIHGLFLFELGSAMNEESLELARSVNIPAVAAINAFRYTMAKVDEDAGAAADVRRLRALGVEYFQIDSRYQRLFGPASPAQ